MELKEKFKQEREYYPALAHWTYLDHASGGLYPSYSTQAMKAYLDDMSENSMTFREFTETWDFADEMFLFTKRDSVYYEEANKLFKSSGMNLNTSFFIDRAELIKKYVSDSRHIGFLARSTLKNEIESGSLVCLEFDGPSMMIDIVAVTLLKSNQEPMIQELIHIAGKYAL